MYIPDKEVFGSRRIRIAIGWLDRNHPFERGKTTPEFLVKLKQFAARYGDSATALGWGAMGGCHTCEFSEKALGFGSFGVPAGDLLYCAPDMIAHYVEQHDYSPPPEFIAALMASPLPGTSAYVEVVRRFRAS
jgi:hypothetical protein